MLPDELIQQYDQTSTVLRDACYQRAKSTSNFAVEAFTRWEQSALALRKFRCAELELLARASTTRHKWIAEHMDGVRFYGEAFYYFAFRFCRIVRKVGFENKSGAVGAHPRPERFSLLLRPQARRRQRYTRQRSTAAHGKASFAD